LKDQIPLKYLRIKQPPLLRNFCLVRAPLSVSHIVTLCPQTKVLPLRSVFVHGTMRILLLQDHHLLQTGPSYPISTILSSSRLEVLSSAIFMVMEYGLAVLGIEK